MELFSIFSPVNSTNQSRIEKDTSNPQMHHKTDHNMVRVRYTPFHPYIDPNTKANK